MNNQEAIEKLTNLLNAYEYAQKTNTQVMVELNGMEAKAINLAIKAVEVCGKIKAIIDGWAVDDDEHELLNQIADIISEEAEND